MIKEITGYSYNDLTIVPSCISNISSRSECDPFIKRKFLPIFASPMASIVNEYNYYEFKNNGIYPILPRNIDINRRILLMNDGCIVALSLKEFEHYFIEDVEQRKNDSGKSYFVCVDIANGHMKSLYDKCYEAKQLAKKYSYNMIIMTGNIANPETYKWICELNHSHNERIIDFIRVGIGGGSGCITTSNTSIHYPQASLIDKCYFIKESLSTIRDNLGERKYNIKHFPAIVADGGIRNYDHVIKALALGADYVMIGSLFAQCIESAGEKFIEQNTKQLPLQIKKYEEYEVDSKGNWSAHITDSTMDNRYRVILGKIDVKFFGMASADGQKSISGEKTKTAEGITKYLPVKYTLKSWTENMVSYLRSAMSYTDCKKLNEFIGKPDLIINSISEIHAVNK